MAPTLNHDVRQSFDIPTRHPRVVFVTGRLDGETSGLDCVASALANEFSTLGVPVTIYAGGCKQKSLPESLLHPPTQCVTAPGLWLGGLTYSPALRRILERAVAECDVVHHHSIWMLPNHYAAAAAFRLGKPYLYQLHGMLEPGALRRSRWKKWIVAKWFQDLDFRRARCMHVLTRQELLGVRAYGLNHPTAIIPNGVDIAPFANPPPRSAFDARFPELAGKRLCLFLSRLHAKKGLPHLIEAWHRVAGEHPDWHLVIAGPDWGMESTCRRMVRDFALEASVTFTGELFGDRKTEAYAAAGLFVLPSFSEGFSMAILEALAAGVPVLITPECNFPESEAAGAGIQVAPNADAVEAGMRSLLAASPTELAQMGARGRALVANRYTWSQVAGMVLQLYDWMLGGGAAPQFVDTA